MSEKKTKAESQAIRLNKFLARAGYCSRRKADELIAQGRVTLNDQLVLQIGSKILPECDRILIDGQEIQNQAEMQENIYVLLNKPVQVVSSVQDPQKRKTVLDLLPHELVQKRIFPVGRLDYMSEGLLLLTNDGDLTYRLTHPRWHVPKVYQVKIRGHVSRDKLQIMRKGMILKEGEKLAPIKVYNVKQENQHTLLEMQLKQGLNRQIRRMCRDLELTILSLQRTAQGPVHLSSLSPGTWRYLTSTELKNLKNQVQL